MKMKDVYFEKTPIKIVLTVNRQVIVKNVKEHLLIKVKNFEEKFIYLSFSDQ